jgi:hypothetical protein
MTLRPPETRPHLQPGDCTVCAYCRTALVATIQGFTLATDEDLAGLDPVVRQVLTALMTAPINVPEWVLPSPVRKRM